MLVTQAVISVPVGGDGVTPVSPTNPAATPLAITDPARAQIELLMSIDNRLGALLILLTDMLGSRANPADLIMAADKDLNVN